jgi:hypothetical protein
VRGSSVRFPLAPRRSGRGGRQPLQFLSDSCEHAVTIRHHVAVPKPQHAQSEPLQSVGPFAVVRSLTRDRVLPAVELDDQVRAAAKEIDDVSTDPMLPPKLPSGESVSTELSPQQRFGVGLVRAKSPRTVEKTLVALVGMHSHMRCRDRTPPLPGLPPGRGEGGKSRREKYRSRSSASETIPSPPRTGERARERGGATPGESRHLADSPSPRPSPRPGPSRSRRHRLRIRRVPPARSSAAAARRWRS